MEDFIRDNWLTLLLLSVQGLWGWALWALRKQFVSTENHAACQDKRGKRFVEAETCIASLAHRLEIVERDVKALPTVQGINTLMVELEKVRGEMQGYRADMQNQRDLMQRTERQIALLIENELKGARA